MNFNALKKHTTRTKIGYSCMADVPLSAEAKAVVAQTYLTGVTPEVSTFIDIKNGASFNQEIWRALLMAGWGEHLGQYIEIIELHNATDDEALRLVQLAINSGTALFALCNVKKADDLRCYLSIHHALADEHTLTVLSRLVQLAYAGNLGKALHEINQGRELYYRYVERQGSAEKKDGVPNELYPYSMTPVKLSKEGRLAWSTLAQRVSLDRIVPIERTNHQKELPVIGVLAWLRGAGVISEGDIVCSSRCWRLPNESGAVGMMTGLMAMSLQPEENVLVTEQTSLEARARYSSSAREALACCRASELFINGAVSRGIPASEVRSATFPVGIDMRQTRVSELQLALEGPFCSKNSATELLDKLATIFSEISLPTSASS